MARRSPRRSSPSGAGRRETLRSAATLLLALFAAAAGTLEIHPHEEGIGGDFAHRALQGESVLSGASHPASATHVEPAGPVVTYRCPVCLLHLHSAGEAPDRAISAPPPEPSHAGPPAAEIPFSAAALHPGGSRAPPVR